MRAIALNQHNIMLASHVIAPESHVIAPDSHVTVLVIAPDSLTHMSQYLS